MMQTPTLLLLGGYGHTGRALARHLLAQTDARLVIAGRSRARAEQAAAEWSVRHPGRVRGLAADAADRASLERAFSGVDLVAVVSSTSRHTANLAAAALEHGLDWIDAQYSAAKLATLQALSPRLEAAGRCFLTDGGFHPGLPALLVRAAAPRFDRLTAAHVGSVIQVDWASLSLSPETLEEFVGEFLDYLPLHFRSGRWRRAGWLEMAMSRWSDFGHGFGRRYGVPMFLEELRPLPEQLPDLEQLGFYVGGFNWAVDWVLMPLALGLTRLAPRRGLRPAARLMDWGLRRFSRPPFGTLLKLEATGLKDGATARLEISLYHPDGYELTAVPMAACLLQWLDGSIRRPGLWFQALSADPPRLLADMQRMGVQVEVHPR